MTTYAPVLRRARAAFLAVTLTLFAVGAKAAQLIPDWPLVSAGAAKADQLLPGQTLSDFLIGTYTFIPTRYGVVAIDRGDNRKTDKVHIFFDQFGNSIFASPPHALPYKRYIVHVVYPRDPANRGMLSYRAVQTKGAINTQLQAYGEQSSKAVSPKMNPSGEPEWVDAMTELRPSNTELEFQIVKRLGKDNEDTSKILTTNQIPVSRTYHVSFMIGLLRTNLSNPSFKFSASDSVVNVTDTDDRGAATGMVVFYASPVVWIKDWFKEEQPRDRMYGRNFLDDHDIWERFFFSAGVGVNDTNFKNLLFGMTWEPVRGGSIFVGGHYGEVNTFNDYDPDERMSESQYNSRKGTEWKSALAFGINMDLLVIKNIFSSSL